MNTHPTRLARLLAAPLLALAMSAGASTFLVTDDELDPEVFPAVAESIRANLDGPTAPAGMTAAKQQRVLRSLERIQGFLDDDPVRHASRIRNEQVRLNAVMAPQVAREDGKTDMVCQRIKPVGSNIPTTRCRSRQVIEEEQFHAQREVERMSQMQALPDE
jgi:hypothetical protein